MRLTKKSSFEKWDYIASYYKANNEEIMKRKGNQYTIDPYGIDWIKIFTPIEYQVWSEIRTLGLPLYPQYPVDGVFVDFGDPVKRIAFECDGKDWHTPDKDYARDAKLNSIGWTVFRSSGRECNKPDVDWEDVGLRLFDGDISDEDFLSMKSEWALGSAAGVLAAIGWRFYGKGGDYEASFHETLVAHSYFYVG